MGIKILIVDDTKNIRNMLETCLKVEGYEVETCSNGREGIEKIKSNLFDYAFVDIRMPETSGTEVLKATTNIGLKTRIIIMTAYATVKNAIECTKLGAATYLQKPFSKSKVIEVLNDLRKENFSDFIDYSHELIEKHDYDMAYSVLKKCLSKDPTNYMVYRTLAELFHAKGNGELENKFLISAKAFK